MIQIKSPREIELMRKAGKLAARCLDHLLPKVKEGVTPLEIDRICHEWTLAHDATPAPLNYKGYPKSICISVNEVVCHGIPNSRPFKSGDIVNVDVTPILNGYHGDISWMVVVGKVPPRVKELVDTTHLALWDGIRQVKPGNTLGDIGHAIEKCAHSKGFSVVIEYCGHGIGKGFHEEPSVPHVGKPGQGVKLEEGMTFTIEPMINMGTHELIHDKDGWTVRTKDGKFSAQFEHTVLVTKTGVDVLTLRDGEKP